MQSLSSRHREPYLYLIPGLLVFFVFFITPVIMTIIYSFTNYDGFTSTLTFIGVKNYITIFTKDAKLWNSLKNSALLALCWDTIGVTICLILALILNHIKGKSVFRAAFYIPVVISTVAVGYMWTYMYQPSGGVLNSILDTIGIKGVNWLGDGDIAMFSIIFVDIWKGLGNNMIFFLAGLQIIPVELYEASKIDGANKWQSFRFITFPMLGSTTAMVLLLTTVGCIKSFDLVYVMTNGGPYRSTELITLRIFNEAFGTAKHYFGYASAEATILFLIILAFSLIQLKSFSKLGGQDK